MHCKSLNIVSNRILCFHLMRASSQSLDVAILLHHYDPTVRCFMRVIPLHFLHSSPTVCYSNGCN